MGLEHIVEKIIAEGKAEADKIVQESRKKAADIQTEAEKEAAERAAAHLKETEREASLQANQIMAQARLEKKISLLRQKREILDEVLRKAFSQTDPDQIRLKRQVVVKDGTREEPFDADRLLEELRPRLERDILEALKI
ncbi:MAG: V-type ATP synthase subunit E family protein [Candidatus Aminicenantes bacterium]|nr:V-type ATP synthase subunit E family protein [Candidatus Aminicenantes bacterium]